jgi:protein tyrosine phosphatase (PTP) superfamily phosphohydrolase (DUF442 family)
VKWLFASALVLAVGPGGATTQSPKLAPNWVEITPRLITSGQPSAQSLATLAANGFEAVIYLAPPTVSDAVRDEPEIVRRQGLAFVNIPIKFSDPTERDFDAFVAAMAALSGKRVLVHCQVNLRASTMVFLHRVIVGRENPAVAYEAVAGIWTPHGAWKPFVQRLLRKNGVSFDPY